MSKLYNLLRKVSASEVKPIAPITMGLYDDSDVVMQVGGLSFIRY